ncbi:hypothetical protein K435DRAFT_795703 [Dendrothele bispora CBS 962.96]|uniref:Uncharacterized protein n=1 Tax=Dendrothele bispora (strain CBS 962.96) TaxID=1314807 RepID=A0A4S8M7V4_DENBC|nr:hypothetical protein K435DRAFT_795703 [Dendrothele bispora CBS 962.96]
MDAVERMNGSRVQEKRVRAEQTTELRERELQRSAVDLEPNRATLQASVGLDQSTEHEEPFRPDPEFWESAQYELGPSFEEINQEDRQRKEIDRQLEMLNEDAFVNALGGEEENEEYRARQADQEDSEQMLRDMMENMGLHDHVFNQVLNGSVNEASNDPHWYPYPSKTVNAMFYHRDE